MHYKNRRIAARIPEQDNKVIEKLVKEGLFINKSDFFRHAIKKLLELRNYASE